MKLQKLSRLDLNLLVALQALLEERSVTRAAERLFITQPAMSRVLQRLRTQIGDPLFTRHGNELVPTPRAREIQQGLPGLLDTILNLVSGEEFDPATYVGEIFIASPEFIAFELISKITRILAEKAPGLTLSVYSEVDSAEKELSEGALDFAIDIERPLPDEINGQPLAIYKPAIWMRKRHPLAAKKTLNVDEMLAYPFVQYYFLLSKQVSSRTDARIDRTLREMGKKRNKCLVTNQLMTALETVRDTDALLVGTKYGMNTQRSLYNIVMRPLPEEIPHSRALNFMLLRHKRGMDSAVHNWLAQLILDTAQQQGESMRYDELDIQEAAEQLE